jgi:hypothetical protein
MAKLEALPADDPRRAALVEKAKKLLDRTLQDFKNGYI